MIQEITYALVPFFFSMASGYLAGKLARGAMPLSSINTMLVDYALPFALFLAIFESPSRGSLLPTCLRSQEI